MSEKNSFMQSLLNKEAAVRRAGDESGKNMLGALKEVERQKAQALKGDPITGKGVTKSGRED